ncbi:MAG TPA: ATP-binding cassette domain-containing protein [Dehalococcoidia bacterium]|nr:ATP-binding cassette domain-containing protein [Dehalococcoidia bacterium]
MPGNLQGRSMHDDGVRPTIISTRQLTKRYGDGERGILAVDRLDLDVSRGEIFGLLGPNGAGKTTTIGMLTTRVRPTAGRACIGAIDVAAEPAMAKRAIGVVTQTNTLDRALSVAENLYYHGLYFGMSARAARRRTAELLELFLLTDRADAEVDALSGGMAQRLMIARALVHDPAVLFLDEPSSGIDPQTRLAIWDIIRELNRRGHTILLTTHYMEEADQLCHRIAIMDHGRILAQDRPAALKQSIHADTVIDLRVDGDPQGARTVIAALPHVRSVELQDHNVHILAGNQAQVVADVVAAITASGIQVRDLSINPPTLEAVFIQLTGRGLRE